MRLTVLALVVAAAAAATLPNLGAADHPNTVSCVVQGLPTNAGCPDLTVDGARFNAYKQTRTFNPASCSVQEGSTVAGTRTLLRFTFTTPNVGTADLVVGSPNTNADVLEYGACHGHYHFRDYADYRLWTPSQFDSWNALRTADPDAQAHEVLAAHPELQPIRGDKRGFCVIDLIPYSLVGVPKYTSCSFQGISVGWADEYYHALDGQWIDITGVAGGSYVLEAEVNAEHVYEESRYDNNRAWRTVSI
jgi:hypothetical protein